MSENRNTGTFSAADLRRRMAEREAAKAAEEMRRLKEQQEKQKTVMEEFHKPPDKTPEQVMEPVMQLVNQAAERGQSEVQVYRFPNSLCTDRGRRINNSEPDWDQTLEGRPRAGYEFWRDHLRPLGFHLRAQVLEYPGGMPGDIGFFLTMILDAESHFRAAYLHPRRAVQARDDDAGRQGLDLWEQKDRAAGGSSTQRGEAFSSFR